MADWDARWLELSSQIAGWSKDRSTKVGCVIIGSGNQLLSAGYNGFPRGVDDDIDSRHSREERNGRREKLRWTEHAERNAIYNAARHGVMLLGSAMYLPWYPCADCARGIIQSGIAVLTVTEPDWDDPAWGADFMASAAMLREAGVRVRFVKAVAEPGGP
jgi:dCMP deaminase